jgi:hypothetical protein
MTRTRAATKEKVAPASGPSLPSKSSAFLAKGKEGLRKVSDKMKEKERAEKEKADRLEKERAAARRAVMPDLSEGTAHTESLQVCRPHRGGAEAVTDSRPSCGSARRPLRARSRAYLTWKNRARRMC